eukprot:gene1182-698_t
MGCIGNMIGGVIFTVLQFLTLVFVTVGTPLPVFKSKINDSCLTMWGLKKDCSKTTYYIPTKGDVLWIKNDSDRMDVYGCKDRKDRVVAASALSIVSIVLALVLLIFGVLMIISVCSASIVTIVMCLLSVGTLCATFALIADVYGHKYCNWCENLLFGGEYGSDYEYDGTECVPLNDGKLPVKGGRWKYGEGFALIVVAFVFQVLNLLLWFRLHVGFCIPSGAHTEPKLPSPPSMFFGMVCYTLEKPFHPWKRKRYEKKKKKRQVPLPTDTILAPPSPLLLYVFISLWKSILFSYSIRGMDCSTWAEDGHVTRATYFGCSPFSLLLQKGGVVSAAFSFCGFPFGKADGAPPVFYSHHTMIRSWRIISTKLQVGTGGFPLHPMGPLLYFGFFIIIFPLEIDRFISN